MPDPSNLENGALIPYGANGVSREDQPDQLAVMRLAVQQQQNQATNQLALMQFAGQQQQHQVANQLALMQFMGQQQQHQVANQLTLMQLAVQERQNQATNHLALRQFEHTRNEAERTARVANEVATNAAFKEALELRERASKSPANTFLYTCAPRR